MKDAFLTGSQMYGTPTAESDIDLVLSMSVSDTAKLVSVLNSKGERPEYVDYGDGQSSMKIGSLNLLICHTDNRYISWALGTQVLMRESLNGFKPVTRDYAVLVFSKLREMLGLKQ